MKFAFFPIIWRFDLILKDIVKSGINLKLAIDTKDSKNETIVPLLGMVAGGAKSLSVDVSGTLIRPKTLINGKKVF